MYTARQRSRIVLISLALGEVEQSFEGRTMENEEGGGGQRMEEEDGEEEEEDRGWRRRTGRRRRRTDEEDWGGGVGWAEDGGGGGRRRTEIGGDWRRVEVMWGRTVERSGGQNALSCAFGLGIEIASGLVLRLRVSSRANANAHRLTEGGI